MPDVGINQPVVVAAQFKSDTGPVTGASVLVTVTSRTTGTVLVAAQAATESPAGSGYYTYTVPAALLTSANRLKIVFQSVADGLYSESFARVGDLQDWMKTRREVRQQIARRMDGHDAAWEMDATSGSTTTAVVPDLNLGGEGEYNGMWARFSDGANRGLDRRVVDYDDATTTITFAPALPTAVASGDRVELYKMRASVYDDAIDVAFADADQMVTYPFEERIFTSDGVTTEYALPSDIRTIDQVGLYGGSTGDFLGWLEDRAWSIGPGGFLTLGNGRTYNRELDPFRFGHGYYYSALPSGYTIYVRGTAAVAPPLYDDSYCDLPAGYLIASGHYQLALQRPDMSSVWAFLERQRTIELAKAHRLFAGNSRAVS